MSYAIVWGLGAAGSLAIALLAWWGSRQLALPRVRIDNRIFYGPIEMRYTYCIRVTNKSKRHCLFDVELSSDIVCPGAVAPSLQVWALPGACLKPAESRMYYLLLQPADTSADADANTPVEEPLEKPAKYSAANPADEAAEQNDLVDAENFSLPLYTPENMDFRSVFRANKAAELQVLLKCRHGGTGQTRIFYKKFIRKDFFNHLKLEA